MKLHVDTLVYLYLLGWLLVYILRYCEIPTSIMLLKMKLTNWYLGVSSKIIYLESLNNMCPIVDQNMIIQNTAIDNLTIIQRCQKYMRNKYMELERAYYPIIEELEQKLGDLPGINERDIPDLTIHEFTFIRDWQRGEINSQQVLTILKTMNYEKVAQAKLTRRMTNYMTYSNKEILHDYIIPVRAIIEKSAVPVYITYMQMIERFFVKVSDIEQKQMKITWLKQIQHDEKTNEVIINDLTLNQVIRQIDNKVLPFNNHKYFAGNNIICMDEDLAANGHAIHWIFAPKEFIDVLKKEFNIEDSMDIKSEGVYIKNMIKAYLNE